MIMKSASASSSRPARVVEFHYPETDGRPLGETDHHRDLILYLIAALKLWYRALPDVYVSGNLMLYYVEGDSRVSISPDVFVVKGAPNLRRRVYKLWQEPAPRVVIEVSSRSTKNEDLVGKFQLYRDVLRVREYYIYDPDRDYLRTRMRAWELRGARYVERRVARGRIRSRELGLDLVDDRGTLRLVDPVTHRVLPDLAQAEEERTRAEDARTRAEDARTRAEDARARAEDARTRVEEENRRLRDELSRLRAKSRS